MNYNIINTNDAPIPLGPYAQAIETKNIIFVSGQIPICPKTQKIPENIYQQTWQALKNIKKIIEKIPTFNINHIVKTTLFITNINDLEKINISYKNFFNKYSVENNSGFPARSCVEVSRLPKNAKIKIEAIAIYFK